jgi:hypothetical protein
MSIQEQPINVPQEAAIEINIDSKLEDPELINKYVIPHDIYFLKEKRRVQLADLQQPQVILDKNGKMTLRVSVLAADGKLYKTSTYLGLKDRPKKKRSPRKKKAAVSDAAKAAEVAVVPPAVASS